MFSFLPPAPRRAKVARTPLWAQPSVLLMAMVASVVLANVLLPIALTPYLSLGTPIIALTFLVNEIANRVYGPRFAKKLVLLGFVVALALSLVFAPRRIAIASATAFLCGQLLDVALFARLRHLRWWLAPLVASTAASTLDTALFFLLAFTGTETVWWHFAAADWLCKAGLDLSLLLPFRYLAGPPAHARKPGAIAS